MNPVLVQTAMKIAEERKRMKGQLRGDQSRSTCRLASGEEEGVVAEDWVERECQGQGVRHMLAEWLAGFPSGQGSGRTDGAEHVHGLVCDSAP